MDLYRLAGPRNVSVDLNYDVPSGLKFVLVHIASLI